MQNKTPCFIFNLPKDKLNKDKSLNFIYNALKYSENHFDFDIIINPNKSQLLDIDKYHKIIYIFEPWKHRK